MQWLDENLRAEGWHEVKAGNCNGRARGTNERRRGKPCESCDKGKALVIVEETAGRNGFPGYECLQIWKKVYT